MGTTTPNFSLYKPAVGETGWGTLVDANWDTIDANLTNALPRSYLAGCQLSNDGASPNTKIDIAAGQAQDAGNAGAMSLASTLIKDISAVWAVGSGNGGLASALSPRTINTWYHLFLIKRTDTGVVDAYYDTSVTAANIPAPYTLFRRLGSVKTDGSNNLLAFTQDGDYVYWATPVTDANAVVTSSASQTQTITTPPGVKTMAIMNVAGATTGFYLSAIDTTDIAPTVTTTGFTWSLPNGNAVGPTWCRTNTSSQIRLRATGAGTATIVTLGWYDTRGRNA